jgi:predicted phosphodiesterase
MAKAHPDQVISRNFFRVHSDISEATWNRFFGTFQQFKRSADITLSRHQHRLELDVAKHAGADNYREMNEQKKGWEDKYLRPSKSRFQTIVSASDIHDKECDPFLRRVFIDTLKRVQPEKIVLNGDIFDLPEFGKFSVDPREWDVVGRIRWVHEFMRDIRKACPNAEIIFVEGNHEYRLLRHMSEGSQAMKVVLDELHGMTVPKLLGLTEFEVNYISRSDLGTFTVADTKKEIAKNYYIAYDAILCHHFPEGERMGYPGWNGHHHRHHSSNHYSPAFGAYEWHQLGCGHRRAATYCAGENWGLGFMICHVDKLTRRSQMEYVQLQDHVVVGGRWYTRSEQEFVHHS